MIRLIEHRDSKKLFSLVDKNRDYLRQWLPWVDGTTSDADTKQFIERSLMGYAKSESETYVIIHDEKILGICSFYSINPTNRSAVIGYWLDSSSQGSGLMTESVKDLVRRGFCKLALNKIEIHVAEQNIKSRNIAERLGFINTGVIRDAEWLYDKFVSHINYSLLASEYQDHEG